MVAESCSSVMEATMVESCSSAMEVMLVAMVFMDVIEREFREREQ